jgi:hypothetical protein
MPRSAQGSDPGFYAVFVCTVNNSSVIVEKER